MHQNAKSSQRGRGERAVAGHCWGQTAGEDWATVEGATPAEAGHAVLEAGQSRNSEAAERDAMDVAAVDSGVGLPAMGDHCRSAAHGNLVDGGQGRSMSYAEVRRTQEREGGFHSLVRNVVEGEKEVVFGNGLGFLSPAGSQSSAQPGNHEHGIRR